MANIKELDDQYKWYFGKAIKYSTRSENGCLSEMESKVCGKAKYLLELHRNNVGIKNIRSNNSREFILIKIGEPIMTRICNYKESFSPCSSISSDRSGHSKKSEKCDSFGEISFSYE